MECTIGWIKTESGFILFKNRDRGEGENILSNFLSQTSKMATFEDKKFKGCWLGISKHIGINSSLGPYRENPKGYSSENENFEINKIVLQKARSVEEAADLYQKLFFEKKIGKSYNVIICDSRHANIIELAPGKARVKNAKDSVFRTNTFLLMKELNKDSEIVERSEKRLKKVVEMAKGAKKAEDFIPILKSHSKNEKENICRHDYAVTVGSVSLEVKRNEMVVCHLMNKSPCKGDYRKVILKFT